MHWLLIGVVAMLVLRWAQLRLRRWRRRGANASATASSGSWVDDVWRAVGLETRDWLISGLGFLLALLLLVAIAFYLGPFKPVHEWLG
jgi:hypothetical protein